MNKIGAGFDLNQFKSFSGDAFLIIDHYDDYVIQGKAFQVKKRIELTSEQTLYVVLDASALIGTGKSLVTLPLLLTSTNGLIYFDTYGITSYEGGSSVPVLKLNNLSTIENLTIFKTGITPSGGPANVREYAIGSASTPLYSGGGSFKGETIKLFPAGSIVAGKIVNKESDVNCLNLTLTFYEV